MPVLLAWGPDDKVFSDLYLHDLEARLPHADVHRFVGAAHMVPEDADVAGAVWAWVDHRAGPRTAAAAARRPRAPRRPLWAALDRGDDGDRVAVVEFDGGEVRSISFGELHDRVEHVAAGLVAAGVAPGDRVALLVPPGIDLTVALYACWRMGAVMVLVDSGLGPRNMSRALASAAPGPPDRDHQGTGGGAALRWPGRRIAVDDLDASRRRLLDVVDDHVRARGPRDGGSIRRRHPDDDAVAGVVFTSGSTGPSKGVAYRHHQLQAQRDLIAELYDIGPDDRLVAAFAPFALYGPALGITSAVPDMDVTSRARSRPPRSATPPLPSSRPWCSRRRQRWSTSSPPPATLTDDHRAALAGVRVLLSAGAPVNPTLLEQASDG